MLHVVETANSVFRLSLFGMVSDVMKVLRGVHVCIVVKDGCVGCLLNANTKLAEVSNLSQGGSIDEPSGGDPACEGAILCRVTALPASIQNGSSHCTRAEKTYC